MIGSLSELYSTSEHIHELEDRKKEEQRNDTDDDGDSSSQYYETEAGGSQPLAENSIVKPHQNPANAPIGTLPFSTSTSKAYSWGPSSTTSLGFDSERLEQHVRMPASIQDSSYKHGQHAWTHTQQQQDPPVQYNTASEPVQMPLREKYGVQQAAPTYDNGNGASLQQQLALQYPSSSYYDQWKPQTVRPGVKYEQHTVRQAHTAPGVRFPLRPVQTSVQQFCVF